MCPLVFMQDNTVSLDFPPPILHHDQSMGNNNACVSTMCSNLITLDLCLLPRISSIHFIFLLVKSLSIYHNSLLLKDNFFSFIFISWRLITLQYCSGFCHTLTWISHGFASIPHPDPPSHLPLNPIPLALPSAPGPSAWKDNFKCQCLVPSWFRKMIDFFLTRASSTSDLTFYCYS